MKVKEKVQEETINTEIFKGTDEKYHYLYQITNLINGKYYVGMHSTYKLDDGYDGSGWALEKAYKKYGKDQFNKEILEFCKNRKDLLSLEAGIVDKDFVADSMTYNLTQGGNGNVIYSEDRNKRISEARKRTKATSEARHNMSLAHLGHKHSEETKKKMSKKRQGENHYLYGKHHSEEAKKKMSEARKGKYKGKENPMYGKTLSDEARKEISLRNKGKKLVHRYIDGEIEVKMVAQVELEKYISDGWTKGRVKRNNN